MEEVDFSIILEIRHSQLSLLLPLISAIQALTPHQQYRLQFQLMLQPRVAHLKFKTVQVLLQLPLQQTPCTRIVTQHQREPYIMLNLLVVKPYLSQITLSNTMQQYKEDLSTVMVALGY